ncbi:MAG: hypothetical protein AAF197_05255 [Pseudomonadota bacterium]
MLSLHKVLACFFYLFASMAHAQWQIGAQDNSDPEERADLGAAELPAEVQQFEQEKCSNGGTETREFIDFSTQVPNQMAFVDVLGTRFANTVQTHQLAPEIDEANPTSVRVLFELDRSGGLETVTVFAPDEAQPLREFVANLVNLSKPFPSPEKLLHECFDSVVFSAAFDF